LQGLTLRNQKAIPLMILHVLSTIKTAFEVKYYIYPPEHEMIERVLFRFANHPESKLFDQFIIIVIKDYPLRSNFNIDSSILINSFAKKYNYQFKPDIWFKDSLRNNLQEFVSIKSLADFVEMISLL
jgi:hypothetical protein